MKERNKLAEKVILVGVLILVVKGGPIKCIREDMIKQMILII